MTKRHKKPTVFTAGGGFGRKPPKLENTGVNSRKKNPAELFDIIFPDHLTIFFGPLSVHFGVSKVVATCV